MSETRPLAGGSPAQMFVSADQVTILGDGTAERPLHTGAAGSSAFQATYAPEGDAAPAAVPGLPVSVSLRDPTFGIASVVAGTAAADDDDRLANAIGIVTRLVEGGVVVRSAGVVVLTRAQWDAVAGTSGGLAPGVEYYLQVTPGQLTPDPVTTPGTYQARVGIAISAVGLLLTTPSDPIQQ